MASTSREIKKIILYDVLRLSDTMNKPFFPLLRFAFVSRIECSHITRARTYDDYGGIFKMKYNFEFSFLIMLLKK